LSFRKLKESSDLKKSTLAINLSQLLSVGLAKKFQHGIYAIIDDGKKLLEALDNFIKESNQLKHKFQIAHAKLQIMKPFLERHKKSFNFLIRLSNHDFFS
jgi:hypothetical protein